ncbi:dihydrodipicolinate synthase family protein [Paracoccus sp. TOH]|uniref:dihydrodipicolinate synthase family protein n=1 Tax=Paracoccus sp. TOH TaxID=1263728 RepID=UPI0025AEEDA8|nr:dihydrodipicolinate synthase family protein [Paracoccus sp. TOH]WJS85363.1 dihydrodipicolinate synthase family protein [Paracoccus sp. TOH]
MIGNDWSGVLTAAITPFDADGAVDEAALHAHFDRMLAAGVKGFVVSGSTGEYYSMSADERKALFKLVADAYGDRAMLVAGTSSLNHADTLELTRYAKDVGFDGCMLLPPVYCLPTPAEIRAAVAEVAEIGLPVMLYNNPARVGVGLTPALTAELASIPNVVAYKESARDLYAVGETYYATRDKLRHFAGLEPYLSSLLSRGASGSVSTISNICAAEVVATYDAYRSGDLDEMSRNQQIIDQLYHLMARSGLSNFAFVKAGMAALGLNGGTVRRPHLPADAAKIEEIGKGIRAIYANAGKAVPQ